VPVDFGVGPEVLPQAEVGKVYTPQSLTFQTFLDSTVLVPNVVGTDSVPVTVYIDGFQIINAGGVPSGMNIDLATCSQPGCNYTVSPSNPDSRKACLFVDGTPTAGQAGLYAPFVTVQLRGYFRMPYNYPKNDPVIFQGDSLRIELVEQGSAQGPKYKILNDSITSRGYSPQQLRTFQFGSSLKVIAPVARCNADSVYTTNGLHPRVVRPAVVNTAYSPVNMTLDLPLRATLPTPSAVYDLTFTTFTLDAASGLPPGMSFNINSCLVPSPCVFTLAPQTPDSAANRYCFVLDGTPTVAGEFYPFVRLLANGFAKSQNPDEPAIPLSQLPQEYQSLRFMTFWTTLNVTPLTTDEPCASPVSIPGTGLYPSTNPDTLLPNGTQNQPFNGGTPVGLALQLPLSRNLNRTFTNPDGSALIESQALFTAFRTTAIQRLPGGMSFSGVSAGNVFSLSRSRASTQRICITAAGTPDSAALFEPVIILEGQGFINLGGMYLRLQDLPEALNVFRNFRATTFFRVNPAMASRSNGLSSLGFTLRPNPVTETLTLTPGTTIAEPIRLTVVAANGQNVLQQTLDQPTDLTVDVGHLPAGLYHLRLQGLHTGVQASEPFVKR
jgi:hypothetical protein